MSFHLAALGSNCALFTHWGDDLIAARAEKSLAAVGVDVSLCRKIPGTTSQCNVVLVHQGSKQVILYFGSALARDDLPPTHPHVPKLLYTTLLPRAASLQWIKQAREAEATIVLGVHVPTRVTQHAGLTRQDLLSALVDCDYLMGSYRVVKEEFFPSPPAEELVVWLKNRYPNLKGVLLTDGPRGSIAWFQQRLIRQKAFIVEVVDDTGAGDIYSAVFLHEFFIRQQEAAPAMELAAAYSALACGQKGSRVRVSAAEIALLLQQQA